MKLYIETTIPNFLFADDSPEKRAITEEFFNWRRISPDEFYISELVLLELSRAQLPLRDNLLEAVDALNATVLPITREAEALAERYLSDGILPVRFRDDAIHVAIAILNNLDVVVTWNMKHLANVRRIAAINHTNFVMGLSPIRIHTPEEIIEL